MIIIHNTLIIVWFFRNKAVDQLINVFALLDLTEISLQIFGKHFVSLQLMPLWLQQMMNFGQDRYVNAKERMISKNGIDLFNFPNLLFLLLKVLLFAYRDKVRNT